VFRLIMDDTGPFWHERRWAWGRLRLSLIEDRGGWAVGVKLSRYDQIVLDLSFGPYTISAWVQRDPGTEKEW
jgi:hypothetical protein